MAKISDVVKLKTGYANFINLKNSFEEAKTNADRVGMYRPTTAHRKALERICRGLYQPNDKKFYLLSGSYGTGKSHLSLIFANMLSRSSGDPAMKEFYDGYQKLSPEQGKKLRNARRDGQYLVAICDYTSHKGFEETVLKAVFEACKIGELNIELETEFGKAERLLADWEEKAKDASAIRNYYDDFARALEQVAPAVTVDQLRTGLRDFGSNHLENFRNAYKIAQGRTEFTAQAGNLIPILKNLVKNQEFKDRFKGLAIFFDEFGFTLEKSAYSKDVLQGMMEEICQLLPNVIFVGCIHKDFKAYADRLSQEDASVMSARKTQVDLTNEGIEEIIGAIVEIDKDSEIWDEEIKPKLGILNNMLPVCETLKLFPWIEDTNRIRQRVLEDIYGVHPMALACLLRLSTEIGSDARSTFTFFSGDVGGEEESYHDFINGADLTVGGGALNLSTVNRLFTFFGSELSPRNTDLRDKQRQLVNGYYASAEALRKSSRDELVDEQATVREAVLRTILIYQLCGINTNLENIQFGLYCRTKPEEKRIGKHLEYLDRIGAVFYRQQSKTYELAVGSGPTPYDLVEQYLKETDLHPVDKVKALLEEGGGSGVGEFLEAKLYNLPFGEDKRFKRRFIQAKDLGDRLWDELKRKQEQAAANDRNSYEGTVVYTLCEDEGEIKSAHQALSDIPDDTIIVGIPHEPQPFNDILLKVKACRHYLNQESSTQLSAQTESRLRDIFDNSEDGYRPHLQRIFKTIADGGEACWYGKSGKIVVDKPQQFHQPADKICGELFSKHCRIKHPDLNLAHDDKWRNGKNNALRQAVTMLLESDTVQIDKGNPDNHGEKRYLEKVLLKGSGALRKTGSDGKVIYFSCESDPKKLSDDFPILKEICQRMSSLKQGEVFPMGSFLTEVKSSPYGAGGTARILAMAQVIRAFGERLRIYKDSTRTIEMPLSDYDELVAVVSDPASGVVFEVRDITEQQRELVEEIAVISGAEPLKHGEKRTLGETFTALKEWWRQIPPAARIMEVYEKADRRRLGSLEDAFNRIDKSDRFEFILEKLPNVYTGEPSTDSLTEKEREKIISSFKEDVGLLESGLGRVKGRVAEAVSVLFGEKGDMVQCESAVAKWYQGLNPHQREDWRYEDHDAASLIKRLSDSGTSFETKLISLLPEDFELGEVKNWESLLIDDYTAKWRQAMEAVEAVRVIVSLPEITGSGDVKEEHENHWVWREGGAIGLGVPKDTEELVYTLDGTDPKTSLSRCSSPEGIELNTIFKEEQYLQISVRAIDSEGNYSDQVAFTVTNKEKQYEPVITQRDLYVKECKFEFPGTKDDFKSVLRGISELAIKDNLITPDQAKKFNDFIDEL